MKTLAAVRQEGGSVRLQGCVLANSIGIEECIQVNISRCDSQGINRTI